MIIDTDEPIRADTTVEALATLKPAFEANGSVTAGNAPGMNDGASAVVVIGWGDGAGSDRWEKRSIVAWRIPSKSCAAVAQIL